MTTRNLTTCECGRLYIGRANHCTICQLDAELCNGEPRNAYGYPYLMGAATLDGEDMAREIMREYDGTPTSDLQIGIVPAHDTPERWPAWIRSNPPIDDSGAYRPHTPRNRH